MPKAGFCSQCHRYVWVQANGSCAFGHGSENLRDLHDASSLPGYDEVGGVAAGPTVVAPDEPPAGNPAPPEDWAAVPQQLELSGVPAGVPRFSWGAFLLPFFWSLAYGLPEFALLFLAVNGTALYLLLQTHYTAIASLMAVLGLAVQVAIGFLGPRTYWRRRPSKLSVAEYNRKQIKWIVMGIGFLLLAFVLPKP